MAAFSTLQFQAAFTNATTWWNANAMALPMLRPAMQKALTMASASDTQRARRGRIERAELLADGLLGTGVDVLDHLRACRGELHLELCVVLERLLSAQQSDGRYRQQDLGFVQVDVGAVELRRNCGEEIVDDL
jgi:uncharacterized 2Fe-2S/4Fe-4S cluster protein (DUF4445 family)